MASSETTMAVVTTAVSGLSSCSSAVADGAAMAVETAVDSNPVTMNTKYFNRKQEVSY